MNEITRYKQEQPNISTKRLTPRIGVEDVNLDIAAIGENLLTTANMINDFDNILSLRLQSNLLPPVKQQICRDTLMIRRSMRMDRDSLDGLSLSETGVVSIGRCDGYVIGCSCSSLLEVFSLDLVFRLELRNTIRE